MRISFFLALALGYASFAQAITLEIFDESGENIYLVQDAQEVPSNVGKISISIFEKHKIPFEGAEIGISEIFKIPQRLDVISNSEMKAYGWCFALDGVVPETLTHETPVTDVNSHIEWYYGYAHYKEGEWIAQCVRPKN